MWFNAPAERRCPVVSIPQLHAALDALPGCPVIDSAAAAFQMSATGDPTCISPLMDLVERDPGLSTQILIAANHVRKHSDDITQIIDDPRLAVGLLGEVRLVAQARGLLTVPEQQMQVSAHFNWPQYWMFQNGVAQLSRNTARYMEFHDLEADAHTAGLLHDLGKLLLLRLHPIGFHAILEYSRLERKPLREAERLFLGCTTNELAVHFAEKAGLPRPYINVMRWIDTPAQATEDIDLVCVVSLARDFCRHNHLGNSGDAPLQHLSSIEQSQEWRLLRERVFPSFNLRKYELQAHADCHDAKQALQGRAKQAAVA
jgi:HD-like signal output (HDOD) protein